AVVKLSTRIDLDPLHKRADDQAHSAVSVDVVDAILRVILGDENGGLRPIARARYRLHDLTQREIIVGDHRRRPGISTLESRCVIAGEKYNHQIGKVTTAFKA